MKLAGKIEQLQLILFEGQPVLRERTRKSRRPLPVLRIPSIRLPAAVVEISKELHRQQITAAAVDKIDAVLMDPVPVLEPMDPVDVDRETIDRYLASFLDESFFINLTQSKKHSRHTRCQQTGNRSANHSFEAQRRKVTASFRGKCPDTTDLNTNR